VAHPNVVLFDVRVGNLTLSAPCEGSSTELNTVHHNGVYWCSMPMVKRSRAKSTRAKHVRRSVTLPAKIARQVESLARQRALSDNRVLVELIEQGIEAQRQKEKAFFQLVERFRAANDPEQVKQLGDQLGRFVFGE